MHCDSDVAVPTLDLGDRLTRGSSDRWSHATRPLASPFAYAQGRPSADAFQETKSPLY